MLKLFKKIFGRNKDNEKNKINEMIIIYKTENKSRIRIFGEQFIKNNKKNCKIIIENKEQDISEYINVNEKITNLKIKLKEIKTITNMSYMFSDCKSLISLPDISNWNTNNVTDMSHMFDNCESLPLKFNYYN